MEGERVVNVGHGTKMEVSEFYLLTFNPVGTRDGTQTLRLGSMPLYVMSHLTGPERDIFKHL